MVRGDVRRLASALLRPRAGYVDRTDRTRRSVAARSAEAARQLDVFLGRISDLTIEDLHELHDETFFRCGRSGLDPAVRRLADAPAGPEEAREALDALTPLLERLEADRNPFACVLKALCCVLLMLAGERVT